MSLAGALVVLASLIVSSVVLLLVVALVWYLDRYDREPLHLVAGVFLWGGAVAPALVMITFRGLEAMVVTFMVNPSIAAPEALIISREVQPGAYTFALGLDGVGDTKGMLESEMRERHIKWHTNARIDAVEDGLMKITQVAEDGSDKVSHELEFAHSMILPAFSDFRRL